MLIASIVSVVVLVSSTPSAVDAEASAAQHEAKSCLEAVKSFYDWYVPMTNTSRLDGLSEAVRTRKADFTRSLFRSLNANVQAQARSKLIVGLDFDPFLNAQYTFTHYESGIPRFKNNNCFVAVALRVPKAAKSTVEPELTLQDGRWVFANFHYGKSKWSEDENLLSILHSNGF